MLVDRLTDKQAKTEKKHNLIIGEGRPN